MEDSKYDFSRYEGAEWWIDPDTGEGFVRWNGDPAQTYKMDDPVAETMFLQNKLPGARLNKTGTGPFQNTDNNTPPGKTQEQLQIESEQRANARADAEKAEAERKQKENAEEAIAFAEQGKNLSKQQNEKNYNASISKILSQQRQANKEAAASAGQALADWQNGENQALNAGSNVVTTGVQQLGQYGVSGGSALQGLYNNALKTFNAGESKTNQAYGKTQSDIDYNLAKSNDEAGIAQNEAWNKWQEANNTAVNEYLNTVAQNAYYAKRPLDSFEKPVVYDPRSTDVNDQLHHNSIASYAKKGKVGFTNEAQAAMD